MTIERGDLRGDCPGDLHGRESPRERGLREGSEGYFCEKLHEAGRPAPPAGPPQAGEEAVLPPPQDMGEDG